MLIVPCHVVARDAAMPYSAYAQRVCTALFAIRRHSRVEPCARVNSHTLTLQKLMPAIVHGEMELQSIGHL